MANPSITIIGRLGMDPVVMSNGLRLRVVTNDRMKNEKTGEWEDRDTSWWTIKVWNKLAEQSRDILKKGQEVVITGKIFEENWVDANKIERTTYEVRAESISITPYSVSKEFSTSRGTPF